MHAMVSCKHPPGRFLCALLPLWTTALVRAVTESNWLLISGSWVRVPDGAPQNTSHEAVGYFFIACFWGNCRLCTIGDENGLVRGQEQKRKSRKTSGGKFFGFLLFLLNGGNNTIGLLTVICIIETIGNHFIDFLLGHFSFTFIKNNKIN